MPAGPSGPPLDKAAIFSTAFEAILYGFSVLMFFMTLWVLMKGKKFAEVNKAMLTVALLLFTFSTIHMGVDINRIYLGFVKLRGTLEPIQYFSDISQQTFVFKNAVYSFQTAVGDGVVLYRAYAVWRSPWPVLLPFIVYLGVIAAAIGSVYSASITSPTAGVFFQTTARWITAFYASTFTCNLLATITLAARLWWIERSVSKFKTAGRGTLRPILSIVVDSGLLYSATLFAALMCFVTSNNAQFIVLDLVCPIISISFYGVILRVSIVQNERGKSVTPQHVSLSQGTGSGRNHGMSRGGYGYNGSESQQDRSGIFGTRSQQTRSTLGSSGDDGYPMKTLKVNITQEVQREEDAKPWDA